MRNINVPLTESERNQLIDLASAERRDVRQQAALLLSSALREAAAPVREAVHASHSEV